MPAPYRYFRVDAAVSPNDLGLLPPPLRDEADLANIAAAAEADVLDHYTRPCPDAQRCAVGLDVGTVVERYVWLRGYAPDPVDAQPAFSAAYRREIANVIRWRAARDAKKPNVIAESAGKPVTSKTYRADAESRFPPDFGRALSVYQLDRVRWAI